MPRKRRQTGHKTEMPITLDLSSLRDRFCSSLLRVLPFKTAKGLWGTIPCLKNPAGPGCSIMSIRMDQARPTLPWCLAVQN